MSMPSNPVFYIHQRISDSLSRSQFLHRTFTTIQHSQPITLRENGIFLFGAFMACSLTSSPPHAITAVWIAAPYLLEKAEEQLQDGTPQQYIHWIRTHFMLLNTIAVGAMILKDPSKLPSLSHFAIDSAFLVANSRYPFVFPIGNRLNSMVNLIMAALYCIKDTYPTLFDFLKKEDLDYLIGCTSKAAIFIGVYSYSNYQRNKPIPAPASPPVSEEICRAVALQFEIANQPKPERVDFRSLSTQEVQYLKNLRDFTFSYETFSQHFILTPAAFSVPPFPEVEPQKPECLTEFYDQLDEEQQKKIDKNELQDFVNTANGIFKTTDLIPAEAQDMNYYLSAILLHMDTLGKDAQFKWLEAFAISGEDCSIGHLDFVKQQWGILQGATNSLHAHFLLKFQQLKEYSVCDLRPIFDQIFTSNHLLPRLESVHEIREMNYLLSPFGFRQSDIGYLHLNFSPELITSFNTSFLFLWIQNLSACFTWFNGKKENNYERAFDIGDSFKWLDSLKLEDATEFVDRINADGDSEPTVQLKPFAILATMISMGVIDFSEELKERLQKLELSD